MYFIFWQFYNFKILFKIVLSTLPILLLALEVLLSDDGNQYTTQVSCVFFCVGFATDGLLVLTNWRIMEAVPERKSGRTLLLVIILAPLGTL